MRWLAYTLLAIAQATEQNNTAAPHQISPCIICHLEVRGQATYYWYIFAKMNVGGVCGSPLYTYMWNPKHLNFYNYVAPSVQWVSTLWLTQHTEEDQSKHLPYCRNSTWTFLRHPVHNSRNRLSMGPRCIPSVALSCGDITNDIQRRWTLNKHGVKSAINQKGFCPDHPNGHPCQEREDKKNHVLILDCQIWLLV